MNHLSCGDNLSDEEAFGEAMRSGNGAAAEMLRAMRFFLGENDVMAYLGSRC
jgi:site-specific DNA-methyltransferase (adenine-specific)